MTGVRDTGESKKGGSLQLETYSHTQLDAINSLFNRISQDEDQLSSLVFRALAFREEKPLVGSWRIFILDPDLDVRVLLRNLKVINFNNSQGRYYRCSICQVGTDLNCLLTIQPFEASSKFYLISSSSSS
jgi:hypothetical protein